MNLNTNTKRLTLTKTERRKLDEAQTILTELGRLAKADLAEAAEDAAAGIGATKALLNGATAEEVKV
jgi:hypothetical protein